MKETFTPTEEKVVEPNDPGQHFERENVLEQELEKQLKESIQILTPDGVSQDEYTEQVLADLFSSVKSLQVANGVFFDSPENTLRQATELLFTRVRNVLDDERYSSKSDDKPDAILVKKAKVFLLVKGTEQDVQKYFPKNFQSYDVSSFVKEIIGWRYGKAQVEKLSESEIDEILKTPFRRVFERADAYELFSNDLYGAALDVAPKSLVLLILNSNRSQKRDLIASCIYRGKENGYDSETLQHLIASGWSETCLKNITKFENKEEAFKTLLRALDINAERALGVLKTFNFPEDKFKKYCDFIVTKLRFSSNLWGFDHGLPVFVDEHSNVKREPLFYEEILSECRDIEKKGEGNHWYFDDGELKRVWSLVDNGNLGLLLLGKRTKECVERFVRDDYARFLHAVKKHGQENLALPYLKEKDVKEYAERLAEGPEYILLASLHSLPKNFFGREVYEKLQKSGLFLGLQNNLSNFKDLNEDNTLSYIKELGFESFLENIQSFTVSDAFLKSEVVQKPCREYLRNILVNNYGSKEAKNVAYRMHVPEKRVDEILIEHLDKSWVESGRGNTGTEVVEVFPRIKKLLSHEKYYKSALRDLKITLGNGNLAGAVVVLDSFPIPKERTDTPEMIELASKAITQAITALHFGLFGLRDDLLASVCKIVSSIKKIKEHIPVPYNVSEMEEILNGLPKIGSEVGFNVVKKLIKEIALAQNPKTLYNRILSLLNDIKDNKSESIFEEGISYLYVSRFLTGGSEEDKKRFIEKVKTNIKNTAQSIPSDFSEESLYYEQVVRSVYPQRNYNTYSHIAEYVDRTKDLESYVFDRNGYEMRLSGLVGYRIKSGAIVDQNLINEFSTRIKLIKDISRPEKLAVFLDKHIENGTAKTLEGKILEYFKQHNYTLDTMNVLLAYQLSGVYEQFVAGSEDRVSSEEDQISKNYILLDELVNQYGDNMKETIKAIQAKIAASEDAKLFSGDYISLYEKRYSEILNGILADLNKIPREKITDQTIQKKILKTVKNTFQGVESIQARAEYFASLFTVNDLPSFSEAWQRHINELFVIDEGSTIDTTKVESLQASAFSKLQNEIGKYEEIKEVDSEKGGSKLKKERVIRGHFSKNRENAHARMVADICLASDPNMLKNENYFEFVLFDEERNRCMGTVMLLQMKEPSGKKYLLYCPNPSVGLVSEVSAKKLYQMLTKKIADFAAANNFDGVLVDKRHGSSTNRAGLFQQSLEQSCKKDSTGKELTLDLEQEHVLAGGYKYQKGLQVVWEKPY